jgi:hypothetical protein
MKITRLHGQTLFDVALQYCGSAEAAFEIANLNGVAFDDDSLMTLEVPAAANARIVEYYKNNNVQPSTADDEPESDMTVILTGAPVLTIAGEPLLYINH